MGSMQERNKLQSSLKSRHLSMIAIAGVIGAGLFVGSGAAIQSAGPGVLLAYAAAGTIMILVMKMLGELYANNTLEGSFSAYASKALGEWAGFSIGWLYAWFWVILLGIEATAGAAIMNRWFPTFDQWLWALILMVVLTVTNLFSVKFFGEFEFWFSSIKVVAIVLFIVFGVVAIFGFMPNVEAVGFSNLLGQGGFFPNGLSAVSGAILVVVFSFFGTEIVTIAAGESENPVQSVRKAINSTIWRVVVFYLGSIAVVVALLPWNMVSTVTSPYVAVIELYGVSHAAAIMDFIVLSSVLSCLNSGLYTSSRMLFSLAKRQDAPKRLCGLSSKGVPRLAVLCSTFVGFFTVVLNYVDPDGTFLLLVNTSGAIALLVWLVIAVSQLVLRRRMVLVEVEKMSLQMWCFPYLTWFAIVGIVLLLCGMGFYEATRKEFFSSLVLALCVALCGVVKYRKNIIFRVSE